LEKVIDCNKHDNPVIRKQLKEVTVEEGMAIATKLFQILNKRKDGIGLAANQVGIDAQVAVVNVREPLVFINPKIISKENEINYYEGCLSYPGKRVRTRRYETVEVSSDTVEGTMIFSGVDTGESGKGSWETDDKKQDRALRTLEAVCVQHEIDHLNGVICMDRKIDATVKRTEKKIGRNRLVTIKKGDAVRVMKYKRAQTFLNDGYEIDWDRTAI
jgi:peptide deformylase|tara:strand:- start:802 stop:1449 length:648 start_codon:yes stop_codon:yes gene_type:complete